ncbi:MAG: EAL domain-containing protein, partial [Aeromonadaceae bacterium]|nr:EAL domain-containing protein [Aeromonadaceae bacterium]
AERLELEVTEGCIMADVNQAISTLNRLKQLGVTLSVDDFGTGYSSLSYLKLFPLDKLKIDQSFIFDLLNSNSDAVIVRAIIALGHAMGLIVIAEGVETQEQYAYLHMLHCDEVQGFLRGRPVEADSLPALVAQIAEQQHSHTDCEHPAKTLLLVDDEPSILSALRRTLRTSGYQILTADTAEAALDCMAHYQVGVIVSDNRMPGVTGLELLRQVKMRNPHTVRVMLSGYADLDALSLAVNAGEIFRFISKPWEEGELKVAINDAFDKYDQMQAITPGLF